MSKKNKAIRPIILIRDITTCQGHKFYKDEIFTPVKVLGTFADIKAPDGREIELLVEHRDFEFLKD